MSKCTSIVSFSTRRFNAGIPTRSVTNFASAHDTEGTMTIDDYVDESGEEIELGGDSVWWVLFYQTEKIFRREKDEQSVKRV